MKIENLRLELADLLIRISDYFGSRPLGYKMKVRRAKKNLLRKTNISTNRTSRMCFCPHHVVILGRVCNTVVFYPDGYCKCEICGEKFRISQKKQVEVEDFLKKRGLK